MLEPKDYGAEALHNSMTRKIMEKIQFVHGGQKYDDLYPDGIPTSVVITLSNGKVFDSDLVMYPSGHSRNTAADLESILNYKFELLGKLALEENEVAPLIEKLQNIEKLNNVDL